jgi:hypothetical protein
MDLSTAKRWLHTPLSRRMRLRQMYNHRLRLGLPIRGQHGYVRRSLYVRSSGKSADNYVGVQLGISDRIEGETPSAQHRVLLELLLHCQSSPHTARLSPRLSPMLCVIPIVSERVKLRACMLHTASRPSQLTHPFPRNLLKCRVRYISPYLTEQHFCHRSNDPRRAGSMIC